MGQCGQGHCNTPITKPSKVVGLDGVAVHQIVAGTSHSLAWTALPLERFSVYLNLKYELLYGYLRMLFLLTVFHRIICFLNEMVAYQELFCVVTLLASSSNHKEDRNKKI